VVLTATFRPNEPATPTLLAPAPLVALALELLVSAVAPALLVRALKVRPLLSISVLPFTTAVLVATPTFSATAAPTPTLVLPPST